MDRKLTKKELLKLVEGLLSDFEVWAPAGNEKVYSFSRIEKPEEISLGYRNTVTSPKNVFFPSGETVYRLMEGRPATGEASEKPKLILGIRPCDARAFLMLDKVFGGDIEDTLYTSKRNKSLLVGIACNEPSSTCFCTSVGGGPFSTDGLDVLMVDLGDGSYLLRGLNGRGNEIISKCGSEADKASLDKAESLDRAAKEKMEISFKPPDSLESSEEYWKKKAMACMDCGICAFVCPTCHCFDLVDEGGCKKRIWDTCTFPLFTIMTSGENPREERRDRIRNRVYHKFSWFRQVHGEIACVGCGRCIASCPAGIDITELVNGNNK
ncbi:MAG: 4Fe-4S dicluster domain-containing protein [Candidatus Tritonobacter lacicola]|nr:4Fe-4S dicluster domain-containing protein [Candidatus Tritonobacter lacicola]